MLTMTGGLVDGEMVLEGPLHYLQKARATRLKGRGRGCPTVGFVSVSSSPRIEGKTWTDWFDGYYSRI